MGFSILLTGFTRFGATILYRVQSLGHFTTFFFKSTLYILPLSVSKIVSQIYFIGAKSMLVVCLTGAFTGMVLGFQGYYTLSQFGAEGYLGSLVALSLVRELGPVLSAMMIIARAGSAMTAEIGIMRISDQIDALKTMNIQPIRFLVTPRIVAALISFPLLASLCNVIGILGGYATGSLLLGINGATYFNRVASSIQMNDVVESLIKAIVFGVVTITICCYQGYYTHRNNDFGAKGVSLSTTRAVVVSCVLVLVMDYVLTSFLM